LSAAFGGCAGLVLETGAVGVSVASGLVCVWIGTDWEDGFAGRQAAEVSVIGTGWNGGPFDGVEFDFAIAVPVIGVVEAGGD
jgi:hypothetical protein